MKLAKLIQTRLRESANVKKLLYEKCAGQIANAANACIRAIKSGRSIYLFGNGGSASDAQHFQAELQGQFYKLGKPLPVLAFTTNTSIITAIANDIGFKHIFERQVNGHVKNGDIVIALSTSGNSENVLSAVKAASKRKGIVIGLTGEKGGRLKNLSDIVIQAPSNNVARIQECHTTICHIICEAVKRSL